MRSSFVPVFGILALALATPACAQATWPASRQTYGSPAELRRVAYDRGFREGVTEGERDARGRDAFRYQDERDFQRADIGYDRRFGSPDRYRVFFREGFADGYTAGYRRYAPGYGDGRYGNGRYGDDRYGYGDRGYGDRGYGYPQGRNQRVVSAFDIGRRDGFEKGQEDARDRDRYDPRRHKWYRDAERGYENRYGSKDRYRDEYRRGFVAGYQQAYGR